MIIGDKPPASVSSLYNRRVQSSEAPARETSATPRPRHDEDEIQISAEAMALKKTTDAAAQTEDVRWDKVAELRGKIAKGEYKVPVDGLAKRLANDA